MICRPLYLIVVASLAGASTGSEVRAVQNNVGCRRPRPQCAADAGNSCTCQRMPIDCRQFQEHGAQELQRLFLKSLHLHLVRVWQSSMPATARRRPSAADVFGSGERGYGGSVCRKPYGKPIGDESSQLRGGDARAVNDHAAPRPRPGC